MNRKQKSSGLKAFFEDYGPFLLMIALPISFVLCLLQYFIKPKSMLLLIIALLFSGPLLLKTSIEALAHKQLRNLTSIGAGLLGAAILIWAGFLIFKPESQFTTKTRMLFETRSKAVPAKEIEVSLEISPTTYYPGDKGLIHIRVENNSDHELTLDSVMFETKKKFFDGFVVNYESAQPPISERKEKLGMSIALFFGEEQTRIPPGQSADFSVGIVANAPGDYAGEYYAVLLVGLNSKAMPRGVPEVTEELFLVVLAEE
jgi:hypothetical protein